MRAASGQIRGDDLTRVGINREVQLPPSPVPGRFLQMTDVNPESCTVDQQVDRSICRKPPELDLTEPLQTFIVGGSGGEGVTSL